MAASNIPTRIDREGSVSLQIRWPAHTQGRWLATALYHFLWSYMPTLFSWIILHLPYIMSKSESVALLKQTSSTTETRTMLCRNGCYTTPTSTVLICPACNDLAQDIAWLEMLCARLKAAGSLQAKRVVADDMYKFLKQSITKTNHEAKAKSKR